MAIEVVLPKLGLTQEEGTIVRWLKPEGDRVVKGEPLFEVMTDKATLEVEAPASGVLLRILVPEGGTAPVATPIALIGEAGEAVTAARSSGSRDGADTRSPHAALPASAVPFASGAPAAGGASTAGGVSTAAGPDARIRISPRARALAEARGVDVRTLTGTGPGGRIVEQDVQQALEATAAGRPAAGSAAPGRPAAAAPSPAAARMRSIIARRMMESLHATAQLTLTTEADMADAVRLREEIGAELERREAVHVTYTDLIVRAVALALRDHPAVNARWDGDRVRRLDEIHVGVAVTLDEGLMVPVIRHADRATVAQISARLRDLSQRARQAQIRPEELEGHTFTVTNLGMFDVDAFTPILNPPEAAILGVGRVRRRPVAAGDRVEIRPMMVLSLTFDHRVVDGAPAAQFLQRVKHILEHPYLLLLP